MTPAALDTPVRSPFPCGCPTSMDTSVLCACAYCCTFTRLLFPPYFDGLFWCSKRYLLANAATFELRRRCQYLQALACQPLRRHMSSFVKHYRPMNMAERQRRHDIKDLEAQVRFSQWGTFFFFIISLESHVVWHAAALVKEHPIWLGGMYIPKQASPARWLGDIFFTCDMLRSALLHKEQGKHGKQRSKDPHHPILPP